MSFLSSLSTIFTHKVMGKQIIDNLKPVDKFDDAFAFIKKWEGGYVNDPSDKGGETKFGISKKSYPNIDIKNLSIEQAKLIYQKDYWNKSGANKLDWPLSLVVFDTAVNMGPARAKDFLIQSKSTNDFLLIREKYYRDLVLRRPSQQKFIKGWMNRLNDLRKECSK